MGGGEWGSRGVGFPPTSHLLLLPFSQGYLPPEPTEGEREHWKTIRSVNVNLPWEAGNGKSGKRGVLQSVDLSHRFPAVSTAWRGGRKDQRVQIQRLLDLCLSRRRRRRDEADDRKTEGQAF